MSVYHPRLYKRGDSLLALVLDLMAVTKDEEYFMAITTESGGRYRVGKDATQRSSLGDTLRTLLTWHQFRRTTTYSLL